MTGEYVGQTKKRVEEQLGQARGAILFIDEAYELGKGMYAEEAMTSLVAAMTDGRYRGMVIIIAGYPADLDEMLNRNAGLKSRFTRFLDFQDWETHDCLEFTLGRSNKEGIRIAQVAIQCLKMIFDQMREFPGFGNGRDVDKVWKTLLECRAQRVVSSREVERTITLEDAQFTLSSILQTRKPPTKAKLCNPLPSLGFPDTRSFQSHEVLSFQRTEVNNVGDTKDDVKEDTIVDRDPDVADEVWAVLERSKEAYEQLLRDMKDEEDRLKREEAQRKLEIHQQAQEKLRRLALCPAGYKWYQVGGGWRCSAGGHFVSNAQLERDFTY